tara:strand:+ start:473812 stop:474105 length:294 start_codon:yes stop_codon:yes gene_type:complete
MSGIISETRATDSNASCDWIGRARIRAAESHDAFVVIDCSAVDRISTRELGELIRLHLDCKRSERQLVLENVHDCVAEVIHLTRLDRLIRFDQGHCV